MDYYKNNIDKIKQYYVDNKEKIKERQYKYFKDYYQKNRQTNIDRVKNNVNYINKKKNNKEKKPKRIVKIDRNLTVEFN